MLGLGLVENVIRRPSGGQQGPGDNAYFGLLNLNNTLRSIDASGLKCARNLIDKLTKMLSQLENCFRFHDKTEPLLEMLSHLERDALREMTFSPGVCPRSLWACRCPP